MEKRFSGLCSGGGRAGKALHEQDGNGADTAEGDTLSAVQRDSHVAVGGEKAGDHVENNSYRACYMREVGGVRCEVGGVRCEV